jgi:hypothetical protein
MTAGKTLPELQVEINEENSRNAKKATRKRKLEENTAMTRHSAGRSLFCPLKSDTE